MKNLLLTIEQTYISPASPWPSTTFYKPAISIPHMNRSSFCHETSTPVLSPFKHRTPSVSPHHLRSAPLTPSATPQPTSIMCLAIYSLVKRQNRKSAEKQEKESHPMPVYNSSNGVPPRPPPPQGQQYNNPPPQYPAQAPQPGYQ